MSREQDTFFSPTFSISEVPQYRATHMDLYIWKMSIAKFNPSFFAFIHSTWITKKWKETSILAQNSDSIPFFSHTCMSINYYSTLNSHYLFSCNTHSVLHALGNECCYTVLTQNLSTMTETDLLTLRNTRQWYCTMQHTQGKKAAYVDDGSHISIFKWSAYILHFICIHLSLVYKYGWDTDKTILSIWNSLCNPQWKSEWDKDLYKINSVVVLISVLLYSYWRKEVVWAACFKNKIHLPYKSMFSSVTGVGKGWWRWSPVTDPAWSAS
jgi:hypothetical protein